MKVTIATHNGSDAHRAHNIRDVRVVSKEPHVRADGYHRAWMDVEQRKMYHRLFDKSVEEYNRKQTREDRKITDYYDKICKDKKKHPVYEMIVGVYSKEGELAEKEQRKILQEYMMGWSQANPNLKLCGVYYHADEQGQPHVHVDYIPVYESKRSLSLQTGISKALEQQGFTKQGKRTAQIQWEAAENKRLEDICKEHGLEVDHPQRNKDKVEHLHTEVFKAQREVQTAREEAGKQIGIARERSDSFFAIADAKAAEINTRIMEMQDKEAAARREMERVRVELQEMKDQFRIEQMKVINKRAKWTKEKAVRLALMEQYMQGLPARGDRTLLDAFDSWVQAQAQTRGEYRPMDEWER